MSRIYFHTAIRQFLEPADTVTQHPGNYNNGDIEALRTSLRLSGCYRAVYVSSDGVIVGGHGLYSALLAEGCEQIPIQRIDYPSTDKESIARVLIGDNEIARKSVRDDAALLQLVSQDLDMDLSGTGLSEFDLLRIRDDLTEPLGRMGEAGNPWPVISIPAPPQLYEEWHTMMADSDLEPHELLERMMED